MEKLAKNDCFPSSEKNLFKNVEIFTEGDITLILDTIKILIHSFNGDAEVFYRKFRGLSFADNPITQSLGRRRGALLMSELATGLMNSFTKKDEHENIIIIS